MVSSVFSAVSDMPASMNSVSPARVAHVMAGSARGGAELFFERLAIAQHIAGRPTHALIRTEPGREARLREAGVPTQCFRFGGPLDFWTRQKLRRSLNQIKPDVVVAWMSRAAQKLPEGPWRTAGRLGGYYDLANYRSCTDLIGNTRGLARWMVEQGWDKDKVHYLPNFATDFAPVAPKRPSFLAKEIPFALALGRLHKNKAFDVLIRAMRHLPGRHVVIAGEGPERSALEDLARREGVSDRVHMPGWVAQTGPWLRACTLLVCPSRIEPLGNVVIEALSAQVPVVASAIQGPQEILAGTEDGLLAQVEDDHALAAHMGQIFDDTHLAEKLAANGRARFEREFAEGVVMEQWSNFLGPAGTNFPRDISDVSRVSR
ncbi:glycosyltransferase [Neokomagataea thailandica NBRC 106555]|uniref:Glycosyltransferase n=1 Tax=Neokomagataea thailandica NBRC 106555 TaxID=1223520 RepID=A0ABQ0QQH9_9PROT|nr:glycosyltransferase [Neokomagataea thailandica NBRC 106555]